MKVYLTCFAVILSLVVFSACNIFQKDKTEIKKIASDLYDEAVEPQIPEKEKDHEIG